MADDDYESESLKKTDSLKDVMLALGDERLEILRLAREAARKGYKYDYKNKQYDFNFADGGEVCRGQGRVRKPQKFRVT
tara:strand:+ start:771 stop:1007 length:237 start_codon:yes stop_codon:yes gene_type:complete